jgi:similar to stage IV sporulation protein
VRSHWTTMLNGFVKIEVRGQHIEELVNRLMRANLEIWSIRRNHAHTVELNILVRDYFKLRPFLKETGCRLHVVERKGFPFLLGKLEHRKFFVVGFIVFFLGIFLLSSLVWQVNVEGNETLSKKEILTEARKQGIYPFQWKYKLDNPEHISKEMIKQLAGASWVGVEIKGTQIHIKVVESDQAEKKPLVSPRHLVSSSDAVVTEIKVDKGRSLVKVNQRVKQGDILISGILGDEEAQKIVVADGQVKGLVWHEYQIEIPLVVEYKVYTGENKERKYIVLGNRALQISGYGKLSFSKHEVQTKRNILQWRNYSLPIGWMQEDVMEVRHDKRTLAIEEAKQLGLHEAKEDILLNAGPEAKILEEKILHEKAESGKVYMKVLFEVEHEIGKEQPIIQGE